ncbi:MAG: bifunctional precorrin-2 dehydrogenase/sirohydrochlorin ferrochelatase [Clostridiales bacterium]|nr:bifunctional precorrin-2 dehydrogenase/sirohydrochlorin ferrochelatase [Clostridiales bacterium]
MKKVPIMLDLSGKKVLVVGGGKAAQIKIENFVDCGCEIQVVAPKITENIEFFVNQGKVSWRRKQFSFSDFEGVSLVVAAADEWVNQIVFQQAKLAGILCSTVQGTGDFIFPSAKQVEDLTIAVSTNGKYPLLAKKIVEQADYSAAKQLDTLDRIRKAARKSIKNHRLRNEFLNEVLVRNIETFEEGKRLLEVYREKESLYENKKAEI